MLGARCGPRLGAAIMGDWEGGLLMGDAGLLGGAAVGCHIRAANTAAGTSPQSNASPPCAGPQASAPQTGSGQGVGGQPQGQATAPAGTNRSLNPGWHQPGGTSSQGGATSPSGTSWQGATSQGGSTSSAVAASHRAAEEHQPAQGPPQAAAHLRAAERGAGFSNMALLHASDAPGDGATDWPGPGHGGTGCHSRTISWTIFTAGPPPRGSTWLNGC